MTTAPAQVCSEAYRADCPALSDRAVLPCCLGFLGGGLTDPVEKSRAFVGCVCRRQPVGDATTDAGSSPSFDLAGQGIGCELASDDVFWGHVAASGRSFFASLRHRGVRSVWPEFRLVDDVSRDGPHDAAHDAAWGCGC